MESAINSGTHWKLCVIQSAANKNYTNLQCNCCNDVHANITRIMTNHSRKAATVTVL